MDKTDNMDRVKEFAKKYFLKEISILFCISLILFIFYGAKSDSFLVDVGREAYLPLRILEGKLLYKDLFNVYGPLSYQINAVAYIIFGTSLNTLYLMGFLNAFLIQICTFFISKNFVSRKISLLITLLMTVSCVYIKTLFNFIFPYSYGAVYALAGFLLSVLGVLLYIKNKKSLYLISSFLFAGYAFANKIEYLPYFIFLFASLILFKPKLKTVLASFAAFFLIPTVSIGALVFSGVSFNDFLTALNYINKIVTTPALSFFYNSYGLYFNKLYFALSLNELFKAMLFLIPYSLLLYGLNFASMKYIKTKPLIKTVKFLTGFVLFCTVLKSFKFFVRTEIRFFAWIGIFCLLILAGFALYYLICFIIKNCKIRKKDKMYLFLLISSILVSIKGIIAVSTECYGTFSLAVFLIVFTVFCTKYLPKSLKFLNRKVWENVIINILVVTIALCTFSVLRTHLKIPRYKIETKRGSIYVKGSKGNMNELISYIEHNTDKNATIISAPEGSIINFLTQRKTHDRYYYLIPVNVQLFGEKNIIADFEKNPPDYFLLNAMPYECFDTGDLCTYATGLCRFIEKNYALEIKITSGPKYFLYKRK